MIHSNFYCNFYSGDMQSLQLCTRPGLVQRSISFTGWKQCVSIFYSTSNMLNRLHVELPTKWLHYKGRSFKYCEPPKTSTLLQAIQPSALFYCIYNMCVCMVYQRILFLFVKNEEYQCLFYFPK